MADDANYAPASTTGVTIDNKEETMKDFDKLEIPCAYQGGKQRLAKDIVNVILKDNPYLLDDSDDMAFYDLCCGSGAISIEMVNRGVNPLKITMVDASPWGLFYKRIGDSTFSTEVFQCYIDDIPKDITKIKDHAKILMNNPANDGLFDNMVYKFLIMQACAFGSTATWVEGNHWKKAGGLRDYWIPTETSNRRSPVNPMMPMPNTLFNRVENIAFKMEGIIGYYGDINNVEIGDNSIIYIDPPYDKTCKYGYQLDYIDYIDRTKNTLYLSEGKQLTSDSICLSKGRSKGGINGMRRNANEEWLNIYNRH